jgi:hypothetical protein
MQHPAEITGVLHRAAVLCSPLTQVNAPGTALARLHRGLTTGSNEVILMAAKHTTGTARAMRAELLAHILTALVLAGIFGGLLVLLLGGNPA